MTATAPSSSNPQYTPLSEAFCLTTYLKHWQAHTEQCLAAAMSSIQQTLRNDPHSKTLGEAMAYSLLNGGKRIRPILAVATANALGVASSPLLDRIGCALEMLHTYSLIHDDLPAMDDDDLRRGRPSCHRAFDEATAILAGDALLTLAFEQLTDRSLANTNASAQNLLTCQRILAQSSGALGMVRGQNIDLSAVNCELQQAQLEAMHNHKTGALIVASVQMGALAAGASEPQFEQLTQFARGIGLAFQVQDDCLDVTASTEMLGKQQGADAELGKPTFVTLMGLKAAQEYALSLYHHSLDALAGWDDKADALRALARYIVHRKH